MATNTINTRIILKNDTAENWAKSELVPLAGEVCIEKDTRKSKRKRPFPAYAGNGRNKPSFMRCAGRGEGF